jgi:hypothetical protein
MVNRPEIMDGTMAVAEAVIMVRLLNNPEESAAADGLAAVNVQRCLPVVQNQHQEWSNVLTHSRAMSSAQRPLHEWKHHREALVVVIAAAQVAAVAASVADADNTF